MIIEQLAVLLYGALAVVAALVTAAVAGSVNAAALAFAGVGLVYVFQVVQVLDERSRLIMPLWAFSVLVLLASVVVSVIGA